MQIPQQASEKSFQNIGGYQFREGITEQQITQLLTYTKTDAKVREFSADTQRFKNRAAFQAWSKKDHAIYTLTDNSGQLMGIAWFSFGPIPAAQFTRKINAKDFGITCAVRTYGAARGKHLSKDFLLAGYTVMIQTDLYKRSVAKGLWIKTSLGNKAAVALGKSLGFEQISEPDLQQKIIMIMARL